MRNNKVIIVSYHYVRDLKHSRYPEIKGLDLELFKQQVQFIKHELHPITMEDFLAALEGSYDLPENATLLTFDDGYIDHFTNAYSILKNEGIQGSFFIPGKSWVEHKLLDVNKIHFIMASTSEDLLYNELISQMNHYRGNEFDFPTNEELWNEYGKASRFDTAKTRFIKRMLQTALPEKLRNRISSELFARFVGVSEDKFARELYMNYEQIRCMKDAGMFIGLHGYDHYHNGKLETDHMLKDMSKAMEVMSDFVDTDRWVMNYPYGSYNDDVIQYISNHGCKAGLTVNPGIADISVDSQYILPRADTNDLPPKSEKFKEYLESRHE